MSNQASQPPHSSTSSSSPNILFVMCDELRFPTVFPKGVNSPEEFLARFMPNVHALWKRGVKFTGHYTAANACTPARGALLTGLYSQQTWVCETLTPPGTPDENHRGPQPALESDFPTWGKLLREVGYNTAWAGKWHLSYKSSEGLEPYGFDQLLIPDPTGSNLQGTYGDEANGYHNDEDIAVSAVTWLREQTAATQPWALAVSFVNPHDQESYWAGTEWETYNDLYNGQTALTPITYYSMNNGTDYPPVVSWDEDQAKTPPSYGYPIHAPNWESTRELANKAPTQSLFQAFMSATWGGINDDVTATNFSLVPYPNQPANSSKNTGIGLAPFSYWQRSLDAYTWFCTQVDARIGEVISAVPDEFRDNTVIVFTADHGEYAGAHGFVAGKTGSCYEEPYRIPLIVADPSGRYAAEIETPRTGLTSSVDVLPLLMGIATGGRSWMTGDNEALYGKRLDMLAMLRSASAPGRPWLVFTTDEAIPGYYNPSDLPTHITGLRTAQWKLGMYAAWREGSTDISTVGVELEYYDYATEAGKLELSSEPDSPEARDALQELLNRFIPNELRAPVPAGLSKAQARARAALIAYLTLVQHSRSAMNPSPKSLGWGLDF